MGGFAGQFRGRASASGRQSSPVRKPRRRAHAAGGPAIGRPEKHRKVLKALGLTRLNKTVTLYGTPPVVGAVRKVIHLVEVREL